MTLKNWCNWRERWVPNRYYMNGSSCLIVNVTYYCFISGYFAIIFAFKLLVNAGYFFMWIKSSTTASPASLTGMIIPVKGVFWPRNHSLPSPFLFSLLIFHSAFLFLPPIPHPKLSMVERGESSTHRPEVSWESSVGSFFFFQHSRKIPPRKKSRTFKNAEEVGFCRVIF